MSNETLRILSGSGYVCLPKRELRKDGLVENGEVDGAQEYHVDRVGERSYLVRLPEDGEELPPLAESDVVQTQVALEMQDVYKRAVEENPLSVGD